MLNQQLINSKLVLIVILIVFSLCLLCSKCIYRNHLHLTDPPQDTLERTVPLKIDNNVALTNLEILYTLARPQVDKWSQDAYFYRLWLLTSCEDLTALKEAHLSFLKINRLDIYPKQWYAFVTLDFENELIQLEVRRENRDPPPPLRTKIDLNRIKVSLAEVLKIGNYPQVATYTCQEVEIFFDDYMWNISYRDERSGHPEMYPGVKIDALTGEMEWREGEFD